MVLFEPNFIANYKSKENICFACMWLVCLIQNAQGQNYFKFHILGEILKYLQIHNAIFDNRTQIQI